MRFLPLAVVAVTVSMVIAACGTGGDSVFPGGVPSDDGGPTGEGGPPPPTLGDGSAHDGAGGCTPKTCASLKATCGPQADGCGGLIQCGTCVAPQTCGGGGTYNKCGGNSGCTPKTCATANADCGPVADGCGNLLQCGTCVAPKTCGGGGTSSQCGGVATCVPTTCAAQGATCGPIGDGCNGSLDCGTCAAPTFCGGGGPSKCGGSTIPDSGTICVPKTCAQQNIGCGPAGDGCGNALSCGTCTLPQTCGGGGTPSQCGGVALCTPKTCAQLAFNCGPAGDGCGGTLNCGSCTAPQTCGGGGTPSVCGGSNNCVPKTCAQENANCGPLGDGCGGTIASCGTCVAPQICGGGGIPSQCGPNGDAGLPCTGLCTQQAACDGGTKTSISGTVYAPTNPALGYGNPDPLYGALVYIPNGPVQPFTTGVSCDQCGATASGNPLVSFTTGPDGTFTLANAPCGTNIPLVIQLGRWRRQIVIPSVACCANTALTPDQSRLPRNKSEGDIPLMAISTGSADPIECVLPKIGVDVAEFTNPGGGGRVQLYKDNGAVINGSTPAASTLYGSAAQLALYDMVIFDCVGSEKTKASTDQSNVLNYTSVGGRVFASHYSYVWLFQNGNFSTTAAWSINNPFPPDPLTAIIDTSFTKGQDFSTWLGIVGALSAPNQIQVNQSRHDTNAVNVPPSQQFLYADPNVSPNNPLEFTFNTPVGSTPQCGRVLFSDFHVNTGGAGIGTFPGECPVAPMTPQEKVLEFMLFDLSSCITPIVPPPPTCTPKTCAQQGFNCGPAGDGCGNLIQCGPCTPPQTCGGGGSPGVCGGTPCVPKSCALQGFSCGPAGDGCGGLLQCGPCTPPQTCGGGGVNGQCGAPNCVKKTCAAQNLSCGPAGDGCGGSLNCGPCTPPQTCGGGGVNGQCGTPDGGTCTPLTCAQQNLSCGPAGDGCGGALNCGPCTPPQTCGGGGVNGQCGGCIPKTCADQMLSCGPAGDGCGKQLDCGPCTPPQTCGGGGTSGQCGAPTCTPKTCAQLGFNCGPAGDGCGGTLQCGTCVAPQTCGGGGSAGVCGGIK